MHKFFRLIYCVLICVLIFQTSAFASTGQAKIIKQNKEITNLDELIERAKNGKTDLKTNNKPFFVIKNNDTNEEIKLNALSTTQLLSIIQTSSSDTESLYKTTVIFDPQSAGSGNDYKEKWDSSYSVKAYSTIYWTITDINGNESIYLTKVSGGWVVDDASVSLSNRSVLIGQTGTNAYNGQYANQSKSTNLSTNSFNISVNYGWVPIKVTDELYVVGATSKVTLKRGTGSSWTLTLTNNY